MADKATTRELSRRETEILSLAARGFSNHEIGETIFLAHETIKSHMKRILTALEARNRTEAVALWIRSGTSQDLADVLLARAATPARRRQGVFVVDAGTIA